MGVRIVVLAVSSKRGEKGIMSSKNKRRASWPAIENYFRQNNEDLLVNKHNKSTIKRYFVEGEEPEGYIYDPKVPKIAKFTYFHKLILEPNANRDQWVLWFDPLSISAREGGGGVSFLKMLGGWRDNNIGYGFGENSLFGGRENEIYEYFYEIEGRKLVYPVLDDESLTSLLSLPSCIMYPMCRMKINPFYIGWRFAEPRFAEISKLSPDRFEKLDPESHVQDLASSMCAIEWAHRHPDKFDSAVEPMVALCRSFYVNTTDTFRNIYSQTIETKLDCWAESTGAGGSMTIAIQYDTPEHLEAVIPLLTYKTRYPCNKDDEEGVVKALPLLKGRNYRVSYYLIQNYWNSGFEVVRYEKTDARTLQIELCLPLGRLQLYPALNYLIVNSLNIEERLKARKNLPGDTLFEDEDPFVGKLVYIIIPMVGEPRIGVILSDKMRRDQIGWWSEMCFGENTRIDDVLLKSLNRANSTELLECYDFVANEGTFPMHSQRGSSIDGFEV